MCIFVSLHVVFLFSEAFKISFLTLVFSRLGVMHLSDLFNIYPVTMSLKSMDLWFVIFNRGKLLVIMPSNILSVLISLCSHARTSNMHKLDHLILPHSLWVLCSVLLFQSLGFLIMFQFG